MEKHYLTATVLCLGTLTAFSSGASHAAIPQTQQDALKAIFIEAGGPDWPEGQREGWEEDEISCDAYGITCDTDENVATLSFGNPSTPPTYDTGLSERVGNLSHLERLSITGSSFSLPLPNAMRTLSQLKQFDTDAGWRSGTPPIPLPTWLGELRNLEILVFSYSPMAGNLPDYLGDHENLRLINFIANPHIVGEIPPSIAYPIKLQDLGLPSNNLSGNIPDEWAVPPMDRVLDFVKVQDNQLYSDNPIIVEKLGDQLDTQRHGTRIVSHQYLGGAKVAVSWQAYNRSNAQVELDIFARAPGGEFEQIDELNTSDRHWRGTVPGLSPAEPQEIKIRELDSTGSTTWSDAVLIDTSVVNNTPSFEHPAVDHILTLPSGVDHLEVPGWAYNMTDGDAGADYLRFDNDQNIYDFRLGVSVPSGTLSLSLYRSTTPADELATLQLCDFSDVLDPLGACSEEQVFILRHADDTAGKENLPSFSLPEELDSGTDYSFQEHAAFASNAFPGSNATATSRLQFHNLWTTNPQLFEVLPWISTPSGTLRFQFKDGAVGDSTSYFSLADHDHNSPDNGARHDDEVTPDRSEIKALKISVGQASPSTTVDVIAVESDPSNDATTAPATEQSATSSSTSGGGGTGGPAFLALCLLAAARRR